MKRIIVLFVSLLFVAGLPLISAAGDVNIGVRIGPPPLGFERPPDVVVIPNSGAYIYMIPGTIGLYFYDGYWYRHYEDRWYRSRRYTGGWVHIKPYRVPRSVLEIPPDYYRRLPREYHRIPYGDFYGHWRTWDRDRYWNRYDWYNREYREHERWRHSERRGPYEGGERGREGYEHGGRETHPDERRDMDRGR